MAAVASTHATVIRDDRKQSEFTRTGVAQPSGSDGRHVTEQVDGGGATTGWTFKNSRDELETYDVGGNLISIADRAGHPGSGR
jgi:hypothetical protein